jgi:Tol biopolymer transport system component
MRYFLLFIAILALTASTASCGGSSMTSPDTNGGTRILGIDFGTKVTSLIAFSRENPAPEFSQTNRDLYVMFPDGTHENRLTNNNFDNDSPAFSPDGLALAFISNMSKNDFRYHNVFRLNKPGKVTQLTDNTWEFDTLNADWGPDSIIASQINMMTGVPYDLIHIEEVDPLGKWENNIPAEYMACYDPCISRDGKLIAFCARPDGPSAQDPGANGTIQLFLLKKGETKATQLTHFGGDPINPILARNPSFDSSGTRIVFQTTAWGDNYDIAYVRLTGQEASDPLRLTDNAHDDVEPCFDPGGLWIAFASNRDGNFDIYKTWDRYNPLMIPVQQESTVRLTKTSVDEHNPDWSGNY